MTAIDDAPPGHIFFKALNSKHEILNEDMEAILFAMISTAVLLLCLLRQREADNEAIRTLKQWKEGK